MKNLNLLLLACSFSFTSLVYSQQLNTPQFENESKTIYQISFGANAVNTELGSPLNSPGDWFYKLPISLGIEARSFYTKNMALSVNFAYNGFDGLNYFAIDGSFKYYLNNWIKSEKFEIGLVFGGGIFNMDRTNLSINGGGTITYWFNDKIGVRVRSLAKLALNDYTISNSHAMHNLELVFVL